MRRAVLLGTFVAVAVAAFALGRLFTPPAHDGGAGSKRVLYYVDPMHPSYRSERPGTAPDCGMPLEPVYEGEDPGAKLELMPGAVALDANQQRLIGVRTEVVARGEGTREVRTTGKVEADPGRDYVVTAGSSGFVSFLANTPEGSHVLKGEVLATYVSRDARAAQQSYLAALTRTEWRTDVRDSASEASQTGSALSVAKEQLRLLGMTETQIRELARSRLVTTEIDVASPTDGIVLARNLTPEQRFEKGKDLYRIVDLSRVWIVADLYGEEAEELHPGARVQAKVRDLGKVIRATVGEAPPLFDPMTRTLKLRLEAENPRMLLRPGMFVDLEFEEEPSEGLSVKADAILDSGTRRIVYVESSPGVFEPRTVETGETFGDRVAIHRGLSAGERVVTAGTFMIDSESRMRSASPAVAKHAGASAKPAVAGARDPVCGMAVDSSLAVGAQRSETFGGRAYVFCSTACRQRFQADPGQYAGGGEQAASGSPANPREAMIARIIEFSVRNKFLVLMLVAAGCLWGGWSMTQLPLDATPDLTETQVIILSRWDRSPDLIEDQVTYPIIAAMTGAPHVKSVRGISDFGFSYVYVCFDEGTDIYWARSRTLEYLSSVTTRLPQGARTELGPDATGLGWIFQYVLVDSTGRHSLGELRSYQDWYLKYYLKAVPGVAEVASVGGFTQQYQVNVDPNRLRAFGIPVTRVAEAVREGNSETGARLLEFGGAEYMIRGRGYVESVKDLEDIVLENSGGTPIRVKDVGSVAIGPDIRRGTTDLDGGGEVVSGIVVMRDGSNALQVIDRVKARLAALAPGMPAGVRAVPIYDRSELIRRSIDNARNTLLEVMVTVVLVILLFLWHFPSAAIPVVTIPVTVLLTFIPLHALGVGVNIMSLAGIAIACGAMVDAAIVVVEQTHKKLESHERSGKPFSQRDVVLEAVREVAGPTFFALLVIAVAFLPILALEGQEGKLFRPLALTKSLAMLAAAVLAITLDPVLRLLLVRRPAPPGAREGRARSFFRSLVNARVQPEEQHFLSGPLTRAYVPVVRWTLRWKRQVIAGALLVVAVSVPQFWRLGSEFMPPLEEGSILYMPSTMPGISIAEAQRLLQVTNGILAGFPEVAHVLGKAGRAETATDPAPLSMLETVIVLKPTSQWRTVPTWYSAWAPGFVRPLLRRITPDHISEAGLIAAMDATLRVPGLSNSWTMPIRGRIEMLTTGIRTPVGLKIQGADLGQIQAIGQQVEDLLRTVPGTRSVFAERTADGYFLDVSWDRVALARYGISMQMAQDALATAVGGDNVSTTVAGRERFPVNVRYMRDFRSDLGALGRVLVSAADGAQIPISQLATLRTLTGPAMIRNEDGLLTGYVYVDVAGRSASEYVDQARQALEKTLRLPAGYGVLWSGQYESAHRVQQRLSVVVPVTLCIILLLLYLSTRSLVKTLIVILAVPFSAVGAIWMVQLLGFNMSIAVWLGVIALLGIDAETGVFMLLYLDLAYEKAKRERGQLTREDLHEAIVEGAAKRLRPKFMTFATMSIGLVPVLWSVGAGSAIMKRIAAPMVGGICTSFLLELLVYPAIYLLWRERGLSSSRAVAPGDPAAPVAARH